MKFYFSNKSKLLKLPETNDTAWLFEPYPEENRYRVSNKKARFGNPLIQNCAVLQWLIDMESEIEIEYFKSSGRHMVDMVCIDIKNDADIIAFNMCLDDLDIANWRAICDV